MMTIIIGLSGLIPIAQAEEAANASPISFEFAYIGEAVRVFSGGLVQKNNLSKKDVYHDNVDVSMSFDTEKVGLWKGGTLFIYGLINHGGDPTGTLIGDVQTASNIETIDQAIIHEFWFQQEFGDVASILLGLHDLNAEFYASDDAGLFLNSTFGIGPELSGNPVGTSIFSKAGLAAVIKLMPNDDFSIATGVYDGDPSTRKLAAAEGKMWIGEIGVAIADGYLKLGSWMHTGDFVSAVDGLPYSSNHGIYGIAEYSLSSADHEIGMFVKAGVAPKTRNEITHSVAIGITLHGYIASRPDDDVGIGMARAQTSLNQAETVIELTYRAQINDWMAIQPSVQWINNPGGDPTLPTATVGLLRFEASI
ncbi:MAG: carbohydrate porin [Mariprofundaceae bacterium]|nr:carbohydrate porin [Mariprofundaceae bacterium]